MGAKKPTNPFYVALLPVGVVFALTASAFVVMTIRARDPHHAEQMGLDRLMDQHGVAILIVELAILAILTVAAIASDDFWVRRFEAAQLRMQNEEDLR